VNAPLAPVSRQAQPKVLISNMGFFQTAKDRLVESTAPAVLNETLMRPYGKITSMKVDSGEKMIRLEALLRGEKESITVDVLAYEIAQRNGQISFIAKKIKTSREWITTLAEQKLVDRPIPVPEQLSAWIKRLL
jgi:hypothetical protein